MRLRATDFIARIWRDEFLIEQRIYHGNYRRTLVTRIGAVAFSVLIFGWAMIFSALALGVPMTFFENMPRWFAAAVSVPVVLIFATAALICLKFFFGVLRRALKSH